MLLPRNRPDTWNNLYIFWVILQEFQARGDKEILIVYDIDDFAWPLADSLARKGGFAPEDAEFTFRITDNPKLTQEQQQYLISEFGNAKNFMNIPFYPGVTEIMRPCELSKRVKVKINSNSFSQQISGLKTEQLLAIVPGLKAEDIRMNLVNYAAAKQKSLQDHITLLGEDSPYNVAMSDALCAMMPRKPGWTTHPDSCQIMAGKRVRIFENLERINQFAYDCSKYILEHS